jgi:hypothetical protein
MLTYAVLSYQRGCDALIPALNGYYTDIFFQQIGTLTGVRP